MPVSFYEAIWIFLVYAFLGWTVEVAFAAFRSHSFVNRGFLNGPLCPVYGCGVLAVVVVLSPLKHNILLLFLGSFVLVSVIEFLTGFLLEQFFHNKWWDYSERKFNICGYVCPLFSIFWGLGCTLVLKAFHPLVYRGICIMPKLPGVVILVLLCVAFAVDCVITVASILKFNERLKLLDEVAGKIKTISDELGGNIYEGVTAALEKGGEFRENIYEGVAVAVEKGGELKETFDIKATELKENMDAKAAGLKESVDAKAEELKNSFLEKKKERARLQQQYHRLLSESVNFNMKRLTRAFPQMKSNAYQETLLKWKNYWNDKKQK